MKFLRVAAGVLGFLTVLGAVGGLENNTMSIAACLIYSFVGFIMMAATWKGE